MMLKPGCLPRMKPRCEKVRARAKRSPSTEFAAAAASLLSLFLRLSGSVFSGDLAAPTNCSRAVGALGGNTEMKAFHLRGRAPEAHSAVATPESELAPSLPAARQATNGRPSGPSAVRLARWMIAAIVSEPGGEALLKSGCDPHVVTYFLAAGTSRWG